MASNREPAHFVAVGLIEQEYVSAVGDYVLAAITGGKPPVGPVLKPAVEQAACGDNVIARAGHGIETRIERLVPHINIRPVRQENVGLKRRAVIGRKAVAIERAVLMIAVDNATRLRVEPKEEYPAVDKGISTR